MITMANDGSCGIPSSVSCISRDLFCILVFYVRRYKLISSMIMFAGDAAAMNNSITCCILIVS